MRLSLVPFMLAITLFIPAPAGADDPDGSVAAMRKDIAYVQDCMTKADGSGETAQACVTLAAKACIGRAGGKVSHGAAGNCFARETRIFRQLYRDRVMVGLNWAYRDDSEELPILNSDVNRFQTMMATETAWQTYVEAECRMEMLHFTNGNASMVDYPACQSRLYAERIALLDGLAKPQGWIRR